MRRGRAAAAGAALGLLVLGAAVASVAGQMDRRGLACLPACLPACLQQLPLDAPHWSA